MNQLNDELNLIGAPQERVKLPSKLNNDLKEEVRNSFQSSLLVENPTNKDFSVSYSVSCLKKLRAKDLKKNQIFELTDYEDD